MIRILHTADWHLGQSFFGYDRTDEHLHFLDWLCDTIRQHEVDVLIIAGDVFDVSNPSAASQRMFYRFVSRVTTENPALQLVVVAGNHDSAARLEAPLPLLQEMRTEIKGVVPKREGKPLYDDLIVELKNARGEVEALCLAVPFLRQGDYVVPEGAENTYAAGVRMFYQELMQCAALRQTEIQALVAVGHLQAVGSEIAEKDYSERTIIGGLECVSPDVFDERIAYTALGHIHKAQRVSGKEHVRYAGSPLPMSFAERNYHHGAVLVTLADGKLQSIEKLPYHPLVSLLSVPSGEAVSPGEVLELLSSLPPREEELLAPYLEIKVLLAEPEPMFRNEVEELVKDKQVRLARIVSSYRKESVSASEEKVVEEGLEAMDPLQILKATFEKTYQTDMPNEMVELFQEACRLTDLNDNE